jgi:DNA-binding transcriptional MerR regulator
VAGNAGGERVTVSEFRFIPPERRQMWKSLTLTMSQASALAGVSERQIQHWMDRGYIKPTPDGQRRITGETLDCIVLIRQARTAGVPLRRAAPLAQEYLRREAAEALDSRAAWDALQDLEERLRAVREATDGLLGALDDIRAGERVRPKGRLRDVTGDGV